MQKKTSTKKKVSVESFVRVYIHSSFNNTIITVTNDRGDLLMWSTAGAAGFKGTKKGTPYAAQIAANNVAKKAVALGARQASVFVKGPGPGREVAIRGIQSAGLSIVSIKDITPIPHNGCRAPKPRRV